jgi:hypothetical protein
VFLVEELDLSFDDLIGWLQIIIEVPLHINLIFESHIDIVFNLCICRLARSSIKKLLT